MQKRIVVKILKSAYKGKVVIAGQYVDVTEFKDHIINNYIYFFPDTGEYMNRSQYIKYKKENETEEISEEELKKRKEFSSHVSLLRTQRTLHNLVNQNLFRWNETPKFYTFTFRDEVDDLSVAHKHFVNFIRKFNYKITGVKDKSYLAYIAVPEIQYKRADKTGKKVWHYHVLTYNAPYLEQSELLKMWKHGSVNVKGFMRNNEFKKCEWNEEKKCLEFEDKTILKNVGAYMSKTIQYTAKELGEREVGKGKRLFLSSKNLLQPDVFKFNQNELDCVQHYVKNFSEQLKCLNQKSYTSDVGVVEYTKLECNGFDAQIDFTRFCEENIVLKE